MIKPYNLLFAVQFIYNQPFFSHTINASVIFSNKRKVLEQTIHNGIFIIVIV